MFPNVEIRHLHAVIILADDLSFTRAAQRLNISQSALSKQITDLEEHLRFQLFNRKKHRIVDLTDAGRVFVEEGRSAIMHTERAIYLARAAHEGCGNVLMIGHSQYADYAWISGLLAIRLPLFPKLRIRLMTMFSMELVRSVLGGELNLALVTAPPQDAQITAVQFARESLYVALPNTHPAAHKERLSLIDIAKDEWILFAKRVHPLVHDAIITTARKQGISPKHNHDFVALQHAVHLVSEHVGIAILTKPTAHGFHAKSVVVKPLSESSLEFDTCLIMRAEDDSKLVNEFARAFLRRFPSRHRPTKQLELALSA